MEVLRSIDELSRLPAGCVLSIGNFDGVHIGHQQNIKVARDIATLEGVALAAMTFEPHPVAILHPEKAPGVLTPLPLKIRLIESCSVDYLIVLRDTTSLLRLTAENFVDKFLLKDVRPRILVEGEDFHFGAQRAGSIETLKEMSASDGFNVVVVPAKQVRLPTGQFFRVSSTTIRYMLQSGHVADAAFLLGRPYRLIGQIVPGLGRGRKIGYPTLNMKTPSQIIPQDGVYAGFVQLGPSENDVCRQNNLLNAVFSVGQAITFGDRKELLIEAHVLDTVPDDKAGPWMAMDFVKHIRHQQRFESPQALASQIADDCSAARNILTAHAIENSGMR